MTTEAPVRAGIYCRISLASIGDTTKTDDQKRICHDLAARLGWEVADVYSDDSKSAWQPNRKRKEWDRMIADVRDGKISAIVVYHGDRLLRTHEDLLVLIHLARTRGIKLASPAGMRDLGNYDDQFILEIEASMAKRESANTSRRRKQQYERWRREGKVRPGGRGGRAFGFKTDGVTHIPEETAVVRDAARRVLLGESVGSIARSVTMLTPAGSQMTEGTLRKMLARPRYAGLMPNGVDKAAWAPVLDRGDWEMVCAVLSAKAAGFGYATNARKWLLSGIAVCGECWTPLQIRQSKGRAGRPGQVGYGCVRDGCRKVYRSASLLDAYVTGAVVGRLNNPDNPQPEVDLHAGVAAELASLTARRAETETFIASLADAPASRIEVLNRALDSFDAKIAAIREQLAGDTTGRLLAAHAGITRKEFEALPLDVRRSLVRGTYRVVVLRASGRGPGFRTQDVVLDPVTGG